MDHIGNDRAREAMEASVQNFIAFPFHENRRPIDFYLNTLMGSKRERAFWSFGRYDAVFYIDRNAAGDGDGLFSDSRHRINILRK